MTEAEALGYLHGLQAAGIQPGLTRMRRGLDLLGHPERRLRVVHVAGTNGKGSTARMIQAAATAAGYRTGLYTSPAVTGLRDTITLDGAAIPPGDFAAWTARLRDLQPQMGEAGTLSPFELTALLAIGWFAQEEPALCVIECGMGGRDDATNVFDAPLAAVITSVSLDHTAWLGETVEAIAAHKCGIIKAPGAVITAPGQDPDALGVILETAARQGLTVRQPHAAASPVTEAALGRTAFTWRGEPFAVPLTGIHQRDNALTALETLDALREKGYVLPVEAVRRGLMQAVLPARQEVIRREPLLLLDGAHNPQGIAALADSLERFCPGRQVTAVMGMLADKDTAACAALLGPHCAHIVTCAPENPRALEAAALAAQLAPYCPDVQAAAAPPQALGLARRLAGDGPLLVAGSLYLAETLRPLLVSAEA